MSAIPTALRSLVADPSSNYAAIAILIAAAVALVVLLAVLLIAFALPDRIPQGDESETSRQPSGCGKFVLIVAVIALGMMAAVGISYISTSTNDYCAKTCHEMAKSSLSWEMSAHRSVPCIRCHEEPGVLGIGANLSSRAADLWAKTGKSTISHRAVPESRCLSCHSATIEAPLTARNGESFKHSDVIGSRPCEQCHGKQGHVPPRS